MNFLNKLHRTILIVMVAAFSPIALFGQATNATFKGLIADAKGETLVGASIVVRNEATGFYTGTTTQIDGRYQLRQLPLGGPYTVTVSFTGYATQKLQGYTLNQGDVITVDVKMVEQSTELGTVEITANKLIDDVNSFGSSTAVSANQIKALPLEGRNFSGLVALSPLQGNGAANLGGHRSGSTNITIDGGNFRSPLWAGTSGGGPQQISQEAIREFEISTNDYAVTQGRQGGGAVNAVTKNGTNEVKGTVFFYNRADELASKYDIRGQSRVQDFTNSQWGFSLGGPIIKDKLHYFVAFDRQDAKEPVNNADIQNTDDEIRIGIRKDTLDKFIDIARRVYGVGASPQVGIFERKTTSNVIFARFDYTINDKHKLTFRNNITTWDNPLNSNDNSNINLREVWNKQKSNSYTGLLSLRSNLNKSILNEIKVQFQNEYTEQVPSDELPAANIPRAIVNVRSPIPTATNPNAVSTRTVQLGGQRFTPEKTLYRQLHLVNTMYITKGKYDITLGTDNFITRLEDVFTSELNGRFFFNSMQDFEAQKPSRYVREVYLGQGEPWVRYNVIDASLFGQVDFKMAKNVDAMFGLRWDGTAFLTTPKPNVKAAESLKIFTNTAPVDFNNFQPRFQLTWNVGGKNKDIFRLGGGGFSNMAMYYNLANNLLFDGNNVASIDVSTNVPTPDFKAYRKDPSTAPGVQPGQPVVSTINAMGRNFEIPFTWKANASYNRLLFNDKLRIGVNVLAAHTYDNYVYQERNLVDQPYFRLANEDNRGVYVPADKIGTNGTLNWQDSRKDAGLGRVLELNPDGILDQITFIADAEWRIGNGGYVSVSYTNNSTKDNSSYNCCVANTSTFLPVKDDPRALNYGYSDSQFRDKILVSGATPVVLGFQLGATFNGQGGYPFAFHAYRAGTSLNGDFNEQNDLAFLFDPNDPKTDPALATALKAWFDNPLVSQVAKDYYKENVGKIAPRNGGKNPFFYTIDMRLTKNIKTFGKQSLELSADLFNLVNLFNKNKGRNINLAREARLLNISGFDKTKNEYKYTLNSNTGVDPVGGTPWRLQLGARYNF
jgi:hypothetical protein